MRMKLQTWVLSMAITVSVTNGFAQRQDAGTKVLVPSSAKTSTFTSLLVVVNLDDVANIIKITARTKDGATIGTPLTTTIPVGGRFRSTDILGQLGGAVGDFGPITVESTNSKDLSAISEVSSSQGPAGFFPGVNVTSAWMKGILPEIVDTGNKGTPGTRRTNIGLNTVSGTPASVSMTLHDDSGNRIGNSATVTVPGNGLLQVNRDDLRSRLGVSAVNGFMTFVSNQPIVGWASKIDNGTDDPSFQIAIAATASTPISQFAPIISDQRNNLLFVALALIAPLLLFLLSGKKEPQAGLDNRLLPTGNASG